MMATYSPAVDVQVDPLDRRHRLGADLVDLVQIADAMIRGPAGVPS